MSQVTVVGYWWRRSRSDGGVSAQVLQGGGPLHADDVVEHVQDWVWLHHVQGEQVVEEAVHL